ncbi:RNB domain-containing ribonuclease [Kineosporia sp. A_224]|uniref:RNB domain-containing ribonuclease n=1 Tax=Kineosporia sp. A_224 TaxID=1962180 RepID=UPI000B4B4D75|nr:RNB domain-containing ribonuclease [Kineosporia sp. A_224]
MVRRSIRVRGDDAASVAALTRRFGRIRDDLGVPGAFPGPVVDAAAEAAATAGAGDGRADLRDVPFATVDPVGSTDLDQAMALSRRDGGGWHVDYAIADVPAFLAPGGPVDAEARRRGQTLYAPDRRTPLHPEVLSEDAASLLPDVDRPAFVWRFDLAPDGAVEHLDLVRAVVRSRARLDYGQVQAAADAHPQAGASPDDEVAALAVLLREIGTVRQAQERARGGASLPLPEQDVVAQDGRYRVVLRPALPSEDWNAQLSLMTGMAAADLMLRAGVGLLRTLPAPEPHAVERYRRQVKALGVPWARDEPYGEFLRRLDRDVPAHLAAMHEAGALFRGAGYTPFDGAAPPVRTHAAVAAPYAHVTAPLRRLVDRFGLLVSHAVVSGGEVPGWVREALPALPEAMAASDRLAGELERRCVDVVEAAVLADRVGQVFDAVAVDVGKDGASGKVQMLDPAVLVRAQGPLTVGTALKVRLEAVDVEAGSVRVVPVG